MLVLIGLTINYELNYSYMFSAAVLFSLFLFTTCMVREPVIRDKSKQTQNQQGIELEELPLNATSSAYSHQMEANSLEEAT